MVENQIRTHYDRQEAMKARKDEGWGAVKKTRQLSELSAYQVSGIVLSTLCMLFYKSSQCSEAGIIIDLERTDPRPMGI